MKVKFVKYEKYLHEEKLSCEPSEQNRGINEQASATYVSALSSFTPCHMSVNSRVTSVKSANSNLIPARMVGLNAYDVTNLHSGSNFGVDLSADSILGSAIVEDLSGGRFAQRTYQVQSKEAGKLWDTSREDPCRGRHHCGAATGWKWTRAHEVQPFCGLYYVPMLRWSLDRASIDQIIDWRDVIGCCMLQRVSMSDVKTIPPASNLVRWHRHGAGVLACFVVL